MTVHTLVRIPGYMDKLCGGDLSLPDCLVPVGMIMRFWPRHLLRYPDDITIQLVTGHTFWSTTSMDEMQRRYEDAIAFNDDMVRRPTLPVTTAAKITLPRCSVCKDNPAECSNNYSGGWVGTKCPN